MRKDCIEYFVTNIRLWDELKNFVNVRLPKSFQDMKNSIDMFFEIINRPENRHLLSKSINSVPGRLQAAVMLNGANVDNRASRKAAIADYVQEFLGMPHKDRWVYLKVPQNIKKMAKLKKNRKILKITKWVFFQ